MPQTNAPDDQRTDFASLAAGVSDEPPVPSGEASAQQALDVIPGLTGDHGDVLSVREIMGRWGAPPLMVLAGLNIVDELDRIAFVTLAPNIRASFGLSDAVILGINGASSILVVTMAIPFAMLADRGRRTTLAGVAAFLWAATAFLTGLARNVWQLAVVRILSGFGKASIEPVHGSLLADYYPVHARGRVYAAHQAANPIAGILGPPLAGAIAYLAGGEEGWRWAFVLFAIPSVLLGLAALRLREPSRGGQERRGVVDDGVAPQAEASTATDEVAEDATPRIPLGTGMRRLLDIQSLRYLFLGIGVLGFGLVAGPALMSLYLEDLWGVGEFGRGVIFSIMAIGSFAGMPLGGIVSDRLFRRDPSWPLFAIGAAIALYTVVTSIVIYLPALWMVVAGLVLSLVGVGVASAGLRLVLAAVSPPALRSLSFAMLGIFIFVFGGFLGGFLFGSISDATDPRFALTMLVFPGVLAGGLVAFGSKFVHGDLAMVVEDILEAERAAERRRQEGAAHLVEVRNLDFSYGPVQVLFDVDLDVPEGEVIALLGTNGAGKSTLLRAITGLDHPTRGSIRFGGQDITFLETEQLLDLGICQMPGGKAVFPGLTVEENLRVGTHTFRKDRQRVREEIAQVEAWFPVLRERRDQLASTLSGGEQQMLAVGKAFLTRPRLLCIDELSLGLAPAITASLLEIVREMHQRGTTIIIVEQSVNIALTLASRAVFMEKGQVRYQGDAQQLLDHPELLRSVFLEGAAGGDDT